MRPLFEAIVTRFLSASGADLRTVVHDKMYPERAPGIDSLSKPVVVYALANPVNYEYTFQESSEMQTVFVDFRVGLRDEVDESPRVIEVAVDKLTTLYGNQKLTVTGFTCTEASVVAKMGPVRTEDDKEFLSAITVKYELTKN